MNFKCYISPTMLKVVSAVLSSFVIQYTFAIEAAEPTEGACIKIMEACKAAGYNKSLLTEKKSLSKNCLQPLLDGQKVEGVTLDSKDIEACKAKKLEVKLKK